MATSGPFSQALGLVSDLVGNLSANTTDNVSPNYSELMEKLILKKKKS